MGSFTWLNWDDRNRDAKVRDVHVRLVGKKLPGKFEDWSYRDQDHVVYPIFCNVGRIVLTVYSRIRILSYSTAHPKYRSLPKKPIPAAVLRSQCSWRLSLLMWLFQSCFNVNWSG